MEYIKICNNDYNIFHKIANAYYREGEDATTPQEEIDAFISFLFKIIINNEINGFFAKDKNTYVGFALCTIDNDSFDFSEIPGYVTILEIGLIPSYRLKGNGKRFISYLENYLSSENITNCYVSAYGPAQNFWSRCGYVKNEKIASNGLPIMVKKLN